MRLRSLDLIAFGPFTNVTLDFSAGAPGGFHLIFGANEAGKSTSLRAVKGFLYGISESSPDAHSHPSSRLRVGAFIEANNFQGRLVRFKRRKNSLVGEDETPFEEERLREALGHLDEHSFETRFGLDQTELEKGAEALLGGREQGLFAAGTAGASVRQVLAELEKEHGEVFTKRGRVRPLNQAVQRYREAARSLSGLIKPPELWAEQEAARRRVLEVLAGLKEARRRTRLEHVELSRLGSMLSQFGELEEIDLELGKLVRSLPGGQPLDTRVRERRLGAQAERSETRRASLQCQGEIGRLEETAHKLTEPLRLEQRTRLLQIRSAATTLREHLGSARNAQAALPRLRARQQVALAEVARLLDGAGIRPSGIEAALRGQADRGFLEAANQSLIAPVVAATLRALLREDEVLRSEQNALNLRIREIRSDLEVDGARGILVPSDRPPLDGAWVSRVVTRARLILEAGPAISTLERKVAAQTERVKTSQSKAGPFASRAKLAQSILSATERANRQEEFERARLEEEQSELAMKRLHGELLTTERELEEVRSGGALPSLRALESARSERDELLRRLSDAEYRVSSQSYVELLERVSVADRISDQLRTDAARVARGTELEAKEKRVREEIGMCETARAAQRERIGALLELLRGRLRDAGADANALLENVPALLGRHRAAEELLLELNELARAQEELEARRADQGGARDALVAALGPWAVPGQELVELNELVIHAESLVRSAQEEERFFRERAARRDEQRRRLSSLEERLAQVETRRAEISQELARLKVHLRLAVETSTGELEAMLAASEGALVPLTEARSAEQRQDGIVRDAEALADQIATLVRRLAPDIALDDVLSAADVLLDRVALAEREQDEANRIERELLERRKQMAGIQRREEGAELIIAELLEMTRAGDLENLERLEETSARVLALREKRERVLSSLEEKAQDAPLAELRAEARQSDHRAIFHRLEAMGEELDALNEQVSEREAELHSLELALSRFQTADAAEVRQLVALRGEEARELIRSYLVKRAARLLLGREVSRYASRFAEPLTERASILFQQLTLGKYQKIRFDPLDAEIRCLSGSRDFTASELSRGARAQMYLALRIASLESYFAHREAIPLVLDDLLVDFDDERAAAAFQVLGELARHVQILYFTHLARDLERAGDAIPSNLFSHHRIGS